ncbi:hypothetical protein Syun_011297 [Stephania yunnanensis]|uniref:Uncharacterized protein n=1 Tax=Stephania yunnanensis TaxID=152371 RepID=A0AAP0JXA8_9MAGN
MLESPLDISEDGPLNFEDLQTNITAMIQQGFKKFIKGVDVYFSDKGKNCDAKAPFKTTILGPVEAKQNYCVW